MLREKLWAQRFSVEITCESLDGANELNMQMIQ